MVVMEQPHGGSFLQTYVSYLAACSSFLAS
jgi:hypothetical protein